MFIRSRIISNKTLTPCETGGKMSTKSFIVFLVIFAGIVTTGLWFLVQARSHHGSGTLVAHKLYDDDGGGCAILQAEEWGFTELQFPYVKQREAYYRWAKDNPSHARNAFSVVLAPQGGGAPLGLLVFYDTAAVDSGDETIPIAPIEPHGK
ncbi:MAG: hypothetical protein HY461_02870, partial [Parcubacteria group bacterium]|nr:hypothetical protein [Parcubacteria group bacterium]